MSLSGEQVQALHGVSSCQSPCVLYQGEISVWQGSKGLQKDSLCGGHVELVGVELIAVTSSETDPALRTHTASVQLSRPRCRMFHWWPEVGLHLTHPGGGTVL